MWRPPSDHRHGDELDGQSQVERFRRDELHDDRIEGAGGPERSGDGEGGHLGADDADPDQLGGEFVVAHRLHGSPAA